MQYIDFCKGPKGFWIGCVEYNNGRTFASGRTMDILVRNMKAQVYHVWRLSAMNVILSSRQMEAGEFQQKHAAYMSTKFKGKFWNEPKPKKIREVITTEVKEEKEEVKKDTAKYTYEEKDGVLYVYEKKLVAKYKIEKQ